MNCFIYKKKKTTTTQKWFIHLLAIYKALFGKLFLLQVVGKSNTNGKSIWL